MSDRGLPASVDAERAILGAILLDNSTYPQAAEMLTADDFSLHSHKQIYSRISELAESSRPIDFVTLSEQLGQHKEVEAVGGVAYVTSLTDGLPRVKNIEQYVRIVKDKWILRQLIHASNSIQEKAYEQESPADEILESAEAEIFKIGEQRPGEGLVQTSEIIKSFGSIDQLCAQGRRITGLETHFQDFDNLTTGLQNSNLIIIAARPSMGKTAFACNIAENVAIIDRKVTAVFSLEQSREELLIRMACSQARIDSHKYKSGFTGREERERLLSAFGDLYEAPIFIDDSSGITVSQMRAKCRRLKQQLKNLDLIIVDYLQLLQPPAHVKENRTQEVSAISRGLKGLAKEMRCPVMALSQLSRNPENRSDARPMLADLRESGSIEQDADLVGFIFREEVYKRGDPELSGKAELIIAKQRNGPIDTVRLTWRKAYTRFENFVTENY